MPGGTMLPGFSCYKQQQFAGFFLYALNEYPNDFIIFLIIILIIII